jgi:hypothetical protein
MTTVVKRKLTAILSVDVEGYSCLMGKKQQPSQPLNRIEKS